MLRTPDEDRQRQGRGQGHQAEKPKRCPDRNAAEGHRGEGEAQAEDGLGGHHEKSLDWSSSLDFLRQFAKQTVRLLPRLGPVKVLRQWAGSYDVTPDRKPVLGIACEGPENLLQASGFSGHGMMISPMVGLLTAQLIAGRKPDMDLRPFRLERFEEGDLRLEGMVIG